MRQIDWNKFLINYRNYLRRAGYDELANLLKNANAEYTEYWLDQDTPAGLLQLELTNSVIHLYDPKHNDILLKAVGALVPDLNVDRVRVSSLLDETSDDGAAVVTDNPHFGSPSQEIKFTCDIFVIMPFAAQFKPIYDDHIVATVQGLKLTIKRGDDFFTQHSVMNDVWSALNACRLVIAECTGRNPNVFYELGIAHTLGKPVVLITQNIEDIPFDLRHLRHIEYENTLAGATSLKKKLEKAISELLPVNVDIDAASDIPF